VQGLYDWRGRGAFGHVQGLALKTAGIDARFFQLPDVKLHHQPDRGCVAPSGCVPRIGERPKSTSCFERLGGCPSEGEWRPSAFDPLGMQFFVLSLQCYGCGGRGAFGHVQGPALKSVGINARSFQLPDFTSQVDSYGPTFERSARPFWLPFGAFVEYEHCWRRVRLILVRIAGQCPLQSIASCCAPLRLSKEILKSAVKSCDA
jgi:hypothetical protein